jgi:hypothetical protein
MKRHYFSSRDNDGAERRGVRRLYSASVRRVDQASARSDL